MTWGLLGVLFFVRLGIRQLQLILLKVSLIVGVEVHLNVEFLKLREPPEEQGNDGEHDLASQSAFLSKHRPCGQKFVDAGALCRTLKDSQSQGTFGKTQNMSQEHSVGG